MRKPKQRRTTHVNRHSVVGQNIPQRTVANDPLAQMQQQAESSTSTGTLHTLQRSADGVAQREVDTSTSPFLPDYAQDEQAGWEKKDRTGVADWAKDDYNSGKGKTGAVDKSSITENLRTTPRTDAHGNSSDPADGVKLWAVHEFLMEETTMIASMTGGKIGSIYFPGGRVRTTHAGGPTVSEHAQSRTLQFNIDPDACWRAFVAASGWLARLDARNDAHMEYVYKKFKKFKILALKNALPGQPPNWATRIVTPDDALPEGTDTDATGVKLFEIMLRENGNVRSTHPSRGAAAQISITRVDLMKLKAVAKSLEGIPDARAQNDAFYRYVTMKLPHLAHLIRSPDEVTYR